MEIIGEAYRELQEIVKSYAKENLPVLFAGETGTGKELFMKLYKESSPRTGKKMTINCAAISNELLWSEVFGHELGSFTGAVKKRDGKIATCDKGILALDEIGDASPEFQAAILRVSEGNGYFPLGSDREVTNADTLIIAATNRLKNLRYDLRERFHILPVPPLQKNDIPAIARYFLKKPLTEKVMQELTYREYRGNIRDLKKTCELLKVERGDSIFAKKENIVNDISYSRFDYKRFRRELNTWNGYIQPLIDYYGIKHEFDTYTYRYLLWDGDSLEWILNRDESLNKSLGKKEIPEDEYNAIVDASNCYGFMCFLKMMINQDKNMPPFEYETDLYTPEEAIKEFKEYMRNIFVKSTLPCLLGYIYLSAENPSSALSPVAPQPSLIYLFDLPLKQAEKEFVKQYYSFNTKRYPDKGKLQKVTGMNKKILDQRISRLK